MELIAGTFKSVQWTVCAGKVNLSKDSYFAYRSVSEMFSFRKLFRFHKSIDRKTNRKVLCEI